jgi:hypothetical protein
MIKELRTAIFLERLIWQTVVSGKSSYFSGSDCGVSFQTMESIPSEKIGMTVSFWIKRRNFVIAREKEKDTFICLEKGNGILPQTIEWRVKII